MIKEIENKKIKMLQDDKYIIFKNENDLGAYLKNYFKNKGRIFDKNIKNIESYLIDESDACNEFKHIKLDYLGNLILFRFEHHGGIKSGDR